MTSRPALLVAIAATLFGTTGTARALGAPDASPLGVGAARLVVGGLALVVLARAAGRRLPRGLPLPLVLAPAALVAAYQLAFFAGLDRAGVAVGTVVTIGSGPPLAGAIGWAAGQGRPSRRWAVATAVAVAGVVALAGPSGGVDPLGVALALASGLGYAGYTVAAKALLDRGAHADAVMASAFGIAGVLLLPVLLASDPAWLATGAGLATALYLGLVPTALAYRLFARGLVALSAATVTTLVLLEPVIAAVLGVAVLDETLTTVGIAGCLLVLAGLLILAGGRASGVRSAANCRAERRDSG